MLNVLSGSCDCNTCEDRALLWGQALDLAH